MNVVREITKINELELANGVGLDGSWHAEYKGSAWVYIGGLQYRLTEGDVITVFSQFGEVEQIHLVRDEATGRSKGFCFLKYEDWRSTVLAVDNMNGVELLGRIIRVDHKKEYAPPKEKEGEEANNGAAVNPNTIPLGQQAPDAAPVNRPVNVAPKEIAPTRVIVAKGVINAADDEDDGEPLGTAAASGHKHKHHKHHKHHRHHREEGAAGAAAAENGNSDDKAHKHSHKHKRRHNDSERDADDGRGPATRRADSAAASGYDDAGRARDDRDRERSYADDRNRGPSSAAARDSDRDRDRYERRGSPPRRRSRSRSRSRGRDRERERGRDRDTDGRGNRPDAGSSRGFGGPSSSSAAAPSASASSARVWPPPPDPSDERAVALASAAAKAVAEAAAAATGIPYELIPQGLPPPRSWRGRHEPAPAEGEGTGTYGGPGSIGFRHGVSKQSDHMAGFNRRR